MRFRIYFHHVFLYSIFHLIFLLTQSLNNSISAFYILPTHHFHFPSQTFFEHYPYYIKCLCHESKVGTPQGSVLGSLLFCSSVTFLSVAQELGYKHMLTILFYLCSKNAYLCCSKTDCLGKVTHWLDTSCKTLNGKKMPICFSKKTLSYGHSQS